MRGRKFDLAFFSPFTYEFSPEYARLLDWRFAASRAALVGKLVEAAFESAFSTAQLLSELFDCNLFVHGSAGIARHDSRLRDVLRNSLTLRPRALGRKLLNERFHAFVAEQRSAGNERLFLLDEMALLGRHRGEADVVSRQIGWEPKSLQVKRILAGLNLQAKDGVFIDDRPDERELVSAAEPAIQVLDATAERSWELLSRWADLLSPQAEGDRTLLYQQREARQSYLEGQPQTEEQPRALFRKLGIRVRPPD